MDVRFETLADVDKFVAEHGRDRLRRVLMEAGMHPASRRTAEVWFWEQVERDRERSADASVESARASLVSAEAAKESARFARLSLVVAVFALLVSIGPQIGMLVKGM